MPLEIPPAWLAAYPGTRIFPEHRLLTWHPHGTLNAVMLDSMVGWIESVEPHLGECNRYIDLSALDAIHLAAADINRAALRRRTAYKGPPTTNVTLAPTPLSYMIAAMYQRVLRGSRIRMQIVARMTSALRILNVPVEVLLRE